MDGVVVFVGACYWVLEAQPAAVVRGPVVGLCVVVGDCFFWSFVVERVVHDGGIDRTLRTTQWTRASFKTRLYWFFWCLSCLEILIFHWSHILLCVI